MMQIMGRHEEWSDDEREDSMKWPEERNKKIQLWKQSWSRWTFSYMSRVLEKGSKQMLPNGTHLSIKDLYKIPDSMEATYLNENFRKFYAEKDGQRNQVLWALWKLAAPTFVPAGMCQLVTVFAQVAIPLLVKELLSVLENNPSEQVVDQGLPYAVGIFVAAVINAFATQRHRHLATKSGVVLRSAVVSVVYENALRLTPKGRQGMSSGEVTNIVAIDTQKLFEVTQEGHLIWSCPLSMILVTIFLLVIMGWTTIIGMVVLFLFVPLVKRIATRMLRIRRERIQFTDVRVEAVNAMLQGIRVTKLNNYEKKYHERITKAREGELSMLRKELFIWALTLLVTVVSPVLASSATFVTFVLVSEENILTASTTFTVLLLFAALRFPINYVGRLIGRAGQALEATRRIAEFLKREIGSEAGGCYTICGQSCAEDLLLEAVNASFKVGCSELQVEETSKGEPFPVVDKSIFQLSGISCSVRRGEVLAVVGPVASGKSTFVNGIIGEVPSMGTLNVNTGKVALASQVPFILNTTLRENILFGLDYDEERYNRVLDACCLRPDIKQLGGAGDLTEIGERGVTLSGGQKARVSIARVAYSDPDLCVFDDPLSALDASTAKKVFDRLFRAESSPLGNAGVVLVTHAAHFLNQCDAVMLLVEGRMRFCGVWKDLASFHSTDGPTMVAVESIRSAVQEEAEENDDEDQGVPKLGTTTEIRSDLSEIKNSGGGLMTAEKREHGLSSLGTWLLWFRHAGGFPFLATQVLLMTLDRLFYVTTEVFLSTWTDGSDEPKSFFGIEFRPQTDGRSAQAKYVGVFLAILSISVLSTFLRSEWAVTGGARCARNVFARMLSSTLEAPMFFFETTPMGRILNRFTFDMEVVDLTLTEAMTILMISLSWFVAGICVMCTILPWVALAIGPITVGYTMLLLHYRRSGADLQRLDAVSRSPIQQLLAEGLDGAPTIRVFRKQAKFLSKFFVAADTNSSALLNFISAQRWLGIRIEVLGSIVVLVCTVMVVSLNHVLKLEAGIVGLLVIWAANFTITLGFMVDGFGEAEAAITSIERVHSMANLPKEKPMESDPALCIPKSWPDSGEVAFDGVSLRYREGLPLALTGLSFTVASGKRCGVVGRSGAGKSSITIALFRLVEIESGTITLDGVDLSTLGLADVRGRAMGIIPQDPFLFSGTVRECIDPFGGSSDEEMLEALKAVRLVNFNEGLEVLENQVEEGGANFSVGERQLLCLARALLQRPSVLVMDEATASVDGQTDAFIQNMLRERFQGTTLITVAHRLNTIMDYDTILVMDKGKAVEFGSPRELLNRNGFFADLVESTGADSAAALKRLVL